MNPQNEARRRAEKGSQWLDGIDPNWPKHLDLVILDLSSARYCVAGQLGVASGIDPYGDPFGDFLTSHNMYRDEDIQDHGFDVGLWEFTTGDGREVTEHITFDQLQAAWVDIITMRQMEMSINERR